MTALSLSPWPWDWQAAQWAVLGGIALCLGLMWKFRG